MDGVYELPLRCVLAIGALVAEHATRRLGDGASKRVQKVMPMLRAISAAARQSAYGSIDGLDAGEVYSWGGAAVDAAQASKDAAERLRLDAMGGVSYAVAAYLFWQTPPPTTREQADGEIRDNIARAVRGTASIEGLDASLQSLVRALTIAVAAQGSTDLDPAPVDPTS